jgi:Tfp pilus assembly protein PilZ
MNAEMKDIDVRSRARVEARVNIRILGVDEREEVYVGNISKDGLFIETRKWKPRLGHSVQLLISLHEDLEPVKFAGFVVRVEKANQIGQPEGVAIEFTKIEAKKTKQFDKFLDEVFEGKGLGCRKYPRATTQIDVEIKNKEIAQQVLSENLSQGGAFFRMKTDHMQLGDILSVVLIHPTSKRKFVLKAEVVHLRKSRELAVVHFDEGIGVQFVDLSEVRKQDLQVFLKSIVSSKKRKPRIKD